ncbi:hypothetical protein TV16_2 [Enterococcus phage vB_EfaS_TV16]|nr:hypothetical protein TV16_2 [Enterococcus phage vB_EfaS_TV16]
MNTPLERGEASRAADKRRPLYLWNLLLKGSKEEPSGKVGGKLSDVY